MPGQKYNLMPTLHSPIMGTDDHTGSDSQNVATESQLGWVQGLTE